MRQFMHAWWCALIALLKCNIVCEKESLCVCVCVCAFVRENIIIKIPGTSKKKKKKKRERAYIQSYSLSVLKQETAMMRQIVVRQIMTSNKPFLFNIATSGKQ